MPPFVATNKAPGVYIEEVQVAGPIAGVGTSTAAFIGPAEKGPIDNPTFLTNFTQFQQKFGDPIFAPTVYVTHAVRGFFDNGGTTCYFLRVSKAALASLTLDDRATPTARPTLVIVAKQEGVSGNDIRVAVTEPSILNAVRAQGTLSAAAASGQKQINLSASDAAKFRSGNIVFLVGANNERAIIDRVIGTTITVKENLGNSYAANDSIRIADLETGQTAIRLNSTQGIDPGTNIRISQEQPLPAPAVTEDKIVQSVDRLNNFITLKQGLTNTYGMEGNNPDVNLQAQDLFTLIVTPPGKVAETFPDLSMDLRHSRYFTKVVDSPTVDVTLADPPSSTPAPNNRPAAIAFGGKRSAIAIGERRARSLVRANWFGDGERSPVLAVQTALPTTLAIDGAIATLGYVPMALTCQDSNDKFIKFICCQASCQTTI